MTDAMTGQSNVLELTGPAEVTRAGLTAGQTVEVPAT